MRQLLEWRNADADQLLAGGTSAAPGGFREFVHSRRLENKITVGINLRLDADNPSDPGWCGGPLLRSWLLQTNLYTTTMTP